MKTDFLKDRIEERYVIASKHSSLFFKDLLDLGFREKKYPETPITQTIYFDNIYYPIPSGISIKLRRYLNKGTNKIKFDPLVDYILEIKKGIYENGKYIRNKERIKTRGSKVLKHIDSRLGKQLHDCTKKLSPIVATQYSRLHFISPQEDFRVTIDKGTDIFFFEEEMSKKIATLDEFLVEIKRDASRSVDNKVQKLVHKYNMKPTISKKSLAFNKSCIERAKKAPPVFKPYKEIEIEKKYDISNTDPSYLICQIRNIFENGPKYFIDKSKYPYTDYTGSYREYYYNSESNKTYIYLGDEYRLVEKNRVYDPNRMERREKKNKYKPINEKLVLLPEDLFLGSGYRIRYKIWIVGKKSKNIFHISTDTLFGKIASASQLEIEYTGIKETEKNPQTEKELVKTEISEISDIIESKIGQYLSSSTKTKSDLIQNLF